MRFLILATVLLSATEASVEGWMQHAFYPVLLGILVLASLGLPIPEDIPLIAAGVLLHTHPGIATWPWTIAVALLGIMVGDLVLYRIGRLWGPEVVRHRFVCRLITPARFQQATARFHRYGVWFCFFGRFVMGVRAAMCMTAGAMHFPYWRFFLADLAGAVLSAPLFISLGYWFGTMIPILRRYMVGVQGVLLIAAVLVAGAIVYYEYRRLKRHRRQGSPPVPQANMDTATAPPPEAPPARFLAAPHDRPSAAVQAGAESPTPLEVER